MEMLVLVCIGLFLQLTVEEATHPSNSNQVVNLLNEFQKSKCKTNIAYIDNAKEECNNTCEFIGNMQTHNKRKRRDTVTTNVTFDISVNGHTFQKGSVPIGKSSNDCIITSSKYKIVCRIQILNESEILQKTFQCQNCDDDEVQLRLKTCISSMSTETTDVAETGSTYTLRKMQEMSTFIVDVTDLEDKTTDQEIVVTAVISGLVGIGFGVIATAISFLLITRRKSKRSVTTETAATRTMAHRPGVNNAIYSVVKNEPVQIQIHAPPTAQDTDDATADDSNVYNLLNEVEKQNEEEDTYDHAKPVLINNKENDKSKESFL